ncbi:hypothetical protein [Moheibacter lacus]|uniref:YhhN-like protein n=1 Tax=Moheibacter lacus TaxID=2745851 RepID=A0A838ZTD9_9FLAO|nr:hypothetical protein [Moheibacter lacus]MBA5630246.1 hypothetical protein [Moheibacter lacus]
MEFVKYAGMYIQLATFIFSVFYYYKYKHTAMKWLPIYLGLVAFVELFCGYYYKQNNVWIYNLVTLVQFNFYAFLFYWYLEEISKKIALLLIIGYNIFYVLSFVINLNSFFDEMASFPHVISVVILIVLLIMMFNQMLRIENFVGFTYNLLFWLCFSLLVFHATSLPLFSISKWNETVGDFKGSLIKILLFSILASHAILIFGFIWSKRKYTY